MPTLPRLTLLFGSHFIHEINQTRKQVKKTSHLVAQNFNNAKLAGIHTTAPTFQFFSQRPILPLATTLDSLKVYQRHITQAYVKSATHLEREIYIHAPKELKILKGKAIEVMKSLYGI